KASHLVVFLFVVPENQELGVRCRSFARWPVVSPSAAMDLRFGACCCWVLPRRWCFAFAAMDLLVLACCCRIGMKEALEATKVLGQFGPGLDFAFSLGFVEDVHEQWEASDSLVIHKIQDLNETGFGETHAALTFKEICRIDPVSTHYESTEKFVDNESTEEAKTQRVNGKRSREAVVAQQRSGRKGSAIIAHELYKKDGENNDPYGSALRGNWRQGSLYY
ncbi:hypothetical protein IFM89_026821, partial [Coptis chinensis]